MRSGKRSVSFAVDRQTKFCSGLFCKGTVRAKRICHLPTSFAVDRHLQPSFALDRHSKFPSQNGGRLWRGMKEGIEGRESERSGGSERSEGMRIWDT